MPPSPASCAAALAHAELRSWHMEARVNACLLQRVHFQPSPARSKKWPLAVSPGCVAFAGLPRGRPVGGLHRALRLSGGAAAALLVKNTRACAHENTIPK